VFLLMAALVAACAHERPPPCEPPRILVRIETGEVRCLLPGMKLDGFASLSGTGN
jgi:hypothetical protein